MLGYRFPIGLEEQIKKWDPETIKAFHDRWYFPANATLFIVGDVGSVSRTIEMIEVYQTVLAVLLMFIHHSLYDFLHPMAALKDSLKMHKCR